MNMQKLSVCFGGSEDIYFHCMSQMGETPGASCTFCYDYIVNLPTHLFTYQPCQELRVNVYNIQGYNMPPEQLLLQSDSDSALERDKLSRVFFSYSNFRGRKELIERKKLLPLMFHDGLTM